MEAAGDFPSGVTVSLYSIQSVKSNQNFDYNENAHVAPPSALISHRFSLILAPIVEFWPRAGANTNINSISSNISSISTNIVLVIICRRRRRARRARTAERGARA